MMNRFLTHRHWLVVPLMAALAGCGGGTDGTGATPPQANVTSSGVMTKGSVILNGVHYDDTHATINDDRNRTSAQLATGMVVKVRGRSDDGVTGTAEKVQVENEVRGPIQSIDPAASPQRFIVAGLTVLVDTQTVYANVAGFAGLAAGNRVEVHGLRDSLNNVRASRVELVGPASVTEGFDEVRGTVSGLNTGSKQFTLNGNLTVNYSAATFAPVGAGEASLAGTGVVVEVHGTLANNTFTATLIDIESLEDADFRGNPNEKQQVEGFVTGFAATPGTFQVNGRTVTTTASTLFVDGTAVDLANNVQVEAEGTIDNSGVLVASKIQFEHARVQLEGLATAVNTGTRTVVVLGQTVQANDLTLIDARANGGGNSTSLADITPNVDCVQVRGSLVGGTFVADEIKEPSGCGKDLVQAPVTGENAATFTLQFFNTLQAALGGGTVQFRDRNGLVMTRDGFFAAVTPAAAGTLGTLVKVKGTLTAGVLVAEEAELEN